jgi:hypothetical protein
MKLWILRPVENLPDHASPWKPWYDKAFGFVVRAETEEAARAFANREGGDETWANPWLDSTVSTCIELTPDGEEGVVIIDFARA